MKIDYKGYVLTIEEIRDSKDNFVKYISCCNQINHFDTWKINDINIIIVRFKREIDNLLTKKEEKEMKLITAEDIFCIFTELEKKYGKDKAIGIFVSKTQESVRLIDGKSAAQILFEKLQEHQNKEEKDMIQDKDIMLVQQFIEAMEKLEKEMEPLLNDPNSGYILTTKLKRIYDFYKDSVLCLSSFESFRDNVVYKIRKKTEEEKKKEKSRPLGEKTLDKYLDKIINTNGLSPGQVDDELTKVYNLLGSIVKCNYFELKKKYFERLESQK